MSHYKFSGHETFHCKHFWPKKGFEFLSKQNSFKSKEAVVELGVGKNMVASIAHWMKVLGLTTGEGEIELTEFANKFFQDDGYDPYIEDKGTLYILHYNLLSKDIASIYNLVFNQFRKTRVTSDFTSKQVYDFLTRKLVKEGVAFSENSMANDVKVFLRMYQANSLKGVKSLEDDFSSLLIGLHLISPVPDVYIESDQVYRIEYDSKPDLHELLFLYAIMDKFPNRESISVEEIQSEVSDVFLCNREGTDNKLYALVDRGYIVYKEDAGRKEVQIKTNKDKWDILDKYYGRI